MGVPIVHFKGQPTANRSPPLGSNNVDRRFSLRPSLSVLHELLGILTLHALNYVFWFRRRVWQESRLPAALRDDGVFKLGTLAPQTTTQLASLVNRRCDASSERQPGRDHRIWHLHLDPNFERLLGDDFHQLALKPFEPRWQVATVMGNRVPNEEESLGSGNGWHRDSNSPQFKIMILLSDVNGALDGAFAFIPESHKLWRVIRTFNLHGRWAKKRGRWSHSEILALSSESSILTGRSGDIFAFNGALLHCGLPNHGGRARVAITFYLYPKGQSPPHILANA